MNANQQQPTTYESPIVEVISVEVEKGFASSTIIDGTTESGGDMDRGGDLGVPW